MAKKGVTSIVNINSVLSEYDNLREQKKIIEARMKVLSDTIKDYAEQNGVKDDKGSYYAQNNDFVYGKQAKKSISFIAEDAIALFERRKWEDCIRTIKSINEDAVSARIESGDLTIKDLEKITTTNTTYAIDVKKKEEMKEVEQTTVAPVAASAKARLTPTAKRGR
jgi:hypothetical protein